MAPAVPATVVTVFDDKPSGPPGAAGMEQPAAPSAAPRSSTFSMPDTFIDDNNATLGARRQMPLRRRPPVPMPVRGRIFMLILAGIKQNVVQPATAREGWVCS